MTVDLADRLPESIEVAAYFVASEALANVDKHARASRATVRVVRSVGGALVEIADDGIGGADDANGSGLRGLADRVEALDGQLRVVSPPGAGTTVTRGDPVRVVIADDSLLIRDGLASLLRESGIDVVAQTDSVDGLLREDRRVTGPTWRSSTSGCRRRTPTKGCAPRRRSDAAIPRSGS